MKYFVSLEERVRSGHENYIEFQLPGAKAESDKVSLYMPESVMEETGFGAFWTQCMYDDIVFDRDTICLDELSKMMEAGKQQSDVVLEVMEELRAWLEAHSASCSGVVWPNFQRWLETGRVCKDQVCLFFCVDGEFLVHGCDLKDAEPYGDFLIYPKSHFEIWTSNYERQYGVDFDYFPRGRVAYCKRTGQFQVLYDRCLDDAIRDFVDAQYTKEVSLGYDEHYQCHRCNRDYVI